MLVDDFVMDIKEYTASVSGCTSPAGMIMFGVSWCSTVFLLYLSKLDPFPIFCSQMYFSPCYNSNLWNVRSSRVRQLTWNLFWINWVSIVSFSHEQIHTCVCAQTYLHIFSFFRFHLRVSRWVIHCGSVWEVPIHMLHRILIIVCFLNWIPFW